MKILSKIALIMASNALILSANTPAMACKGLEITQVRLSDAPPNAPVRAAFLQLKNRGTRSIYIQNWQSPAFKAIELHEMKMNGTQMQMRQVARLRIKPKEKIELEEGGLHLMLFAPNAVLSTEYSDGIPITVECKKSESMFMLPIK